MSKRKLNQAAPRLLAAAKDARRILVSIMNDHLDEEQIALTVTTLNEVITEAEDADWKIKLKMTPRTSDAIYFGLAENKLSYLSRWLKRAEKRTVRRVYFTLDVDHDRLHDLADFLQVYDPGAQTERAFNRLHEQIDEELARSPLEVLAQQGL